MDDSTSSGADTAAIPSAQHGSYSAVHAHLRAHYPKTGICEECGQGGKQTQYAVIHGQPYSRNREDYRELCPRCHVRYDLGGKPRDPAAVAKGSDSQKRAWQRQCEQGVERNLPRGEQQRNAKLTEAQVVEIRQKRAAGRSLQSLAREYGVSKKLILNIAQRKTWIHVPDVPSPDPSLGIDPVATGKAVAAQRAAVERQRDWLENITPDLAKRARGERHGNSKLTESEVIEIRRLHAEGGHTFESLGRDYGVSGFVIGEVVRRKTWMHVVDPDEQVGGVSESGEAPTLF